MLLGLGVSLAILALMNLLAWARLGGPSDDFLHLLGRLTYWAAGVAGDHISEDDIAATLREPMGRVRRLVAALGTHLANGGTIA